MRPPVGANDNHNRHYFERLEVRLIELLANTLDPDEHGDDVAFKHKTGGISPSGDSVQRQPFLERASAESKVALRA
jgi:hypothetical protein